MAFSFRARLTNYEFRKLRDGDTDNGHWVSLIFEDPEEGRQLDVSVPRAMHPDVYKLNLQKGDIVTLDIRAFAGADYSRVSLIQIVSVVDSDGEVQL